MLSIIPELQLTNTKKDVINHLIALHQGRHWGSKTSPYIRAFSGAFSPDMPFTFYFLSETHPIMYVYDPRPSDKRSSREVFHTECEQKKPKILEITDFYEYLVNHEYIEMEYQGLRGRPGLPERYYKEWRKYSDFYNHIMTGLSSICLSVFQPTGKLYEVWEGMRKKG